MKAPMLGLAASTLAFAGSTIYLWTQLDQERARADEVTELTRRLNQRVAELETARGEFERLRLAAGPGAPPGPPPVNGPPDAAGPTASGNVAAETQSAVSFQGPRPDRSPSYQKMMRGQIRANNRRMFADLGDQLGLGDEEAARLIDLLSEHQLASITRMQDLSNPEEMRQQSDRLRSAQQAEIVDLIGPDKAESLRKYQESIPARGEVEMIARQLEGSDVPLKDEQRKRLVAVITEERGRVPMPEFTGDANAEEYSKAASEWQADYEQRVGAQARAVLNNEQYNAYSEYLQWQKEMREQFAISRNGAVPMRGMGPRGAAVYGAPGMVSLAVAVPAAPPEPEKKK